MATSQAWFECKLIGAESPYSAKSRITKTATIHFACYLRTDRSKKMLLFEELPGFLTVLLKLHTTFDSVFVQKQPVTFASTNSLGDCPGSLNGGMRAPSKCLIVVQEWWGMNEQIKEQARHIGELGKFVTLVPDLYRGIVAKNSTEAIHLVRNLDYEGEVYTKFLYHFISTFHRIPSLIPAFFSQRHTS